MKEDLFFGYLGNGLSVADKNRSENGDYKHIAHISKMGEISYRNCTISIEAKKKIEEAAKGEKTVYEARLIREFILDWQSKNPYQSGQLVSFNRKFKSNLKDFLNKIGVVVENWI